MERLISGGALALGCVLACSAAMAAPPAPQYTTDDIVKTFKAPPAVAPSATPLGECEKKGMVSGDDGVCEPAKNERGFSLPTRANLGAGSKGSAAAASRPQPVSLPSRAAAPPTRKDLLITFKTGSSELTEQAQANARVFAQALANPALSGGKFEIAGYTDSTGAADKNMVLSQQRADSVMSFLVAHGVDSARLSAKGYGANDFAVPSQPTAAQNRRVEARRLE
ncbi:MAG TPA: OmpA family protein [Caulobacteraceae bacterium]|jgi:outer membrane protein OmpA-like peptidoglycan-associated protein